MWVETLNPNDMYVKLPLSCWAVSIQDTELKFYFDVWSVPEVSFLQGRRWLLQPSRRKYKMVASSFRKQILPKDHLRNSLVSPTSSFHLLIFFTGRNKSLFADLLYFWHQMLCFHETGLLAVAHTHDPVPRLYTFIILCVQLAFFSIRSWLLGLLK